uniref:Reverse transcriptase zinc-binding domain-containing protein n=1 Tax=Triticum urartu TaxID=4572 RepID=A0A8R7PSA7_TRIUA
MAVDREAREGFDSMVHIFVGRGSKVLFWRDRWIHDFAVKDIAPLIHAQVDTRTINRRTVEEGLLEGRWLLDISGDVNFVGHLQLLHLNLAISMINRDLASDDRFSWPADPFGSYTAKSTYIRLCQGAERAPYATCIWRSWAILKCKIFVWLAVQHQIWTSDKRARHGLQNASSPSF